MAPPIDSLEVRRLSKKFGRTVAVDDVSFSVARGEIVSLLGPSGCGKTTTLRLVAGFESPDGGDIVVQGVSMRGRRPYERNIGLLFQHYALFPHMTVAQNIAFGLRHHGAGQAEIGRAVGAMLELIKLQGHEKRYPHELSGGQQQRVALARALAVKPQLMLLDEPLSALDAKLRLELRFELKKILAELAVTAVVVTHDQDEAMSLAGRVMVMRDGRILQQGTPMEIYGCPTSRFVAEFVGASNWFRGTLGPERANGVHAFKIAGGPDILVLKPGAGVAPRATLVCLRPERVEISANVPEHAARADFNTLSGIVRDVAPLGANISFRIELAFGASVMAVEKNQGESRHSPGDGVLIQFRPHDCIVLADDA